MVVQEMAAELDAADAIREQLAHLRTLESEHHRLSEEIAFAAHLQHHLQQRPKNTPEDAGQADLLKNLLRSSAAQRTRRQELVTQLIHLDRELEAHFNPYWGPIFLARNELSIFGSQVNLYADLYTSSLSNFLAWSPLQYFRAQRPLMPHEV
jgi:5'-nucleotidase